MSICSFQGSDSDWIATKTCHLIISSQLCYQQVWLIKLPNKLVQHDLSHNPATLRREPPSCGPHYCLLYFPKFPTEVTTCLITSPWIGAPYSVTLHELNHWIWFFLLVSFAHYMNGAQFAELLWDGSAVQLKMSMLKSPHQSL